jgi:trimethylamine:corrinoid methyltransferase-like protein
MTRMRHRRFWRPDLIDQNTHDRWLSHGGGTLLERVRRRLQELLDAGPAFTLDPATISVIDDLAGHPRNEHG